jgi:hypothetical protein
LPMDWSTDRFVTQISNIPHPVARVTRRPPGFRYSPLRGSPFSTGRGRARSPPCESVGAIGPATHPTIHYACRAAKTASPLVVAPPAARDRRPEDERDGMREEHRRSRRSRPRELLILDLALMRATGLLSEARVIGRRRHRNSILGRRGTGHGLSPRTRAPVAGSIPGRPGTTRRGAGRMLARRPRRGRPGRQAASRCATRSWV